MKVLGIETSCDDTAVAIVSDSKEILAHQILSQLDVHKVYGGVVPELASRSHVEALDSMVKAIFVEANLSFDDIDAVAATAGPGLIGGIIVGTMVAKGIAAACGKPYIAINHLEGHILTPRLVSGLDFPYLALLVSGGHCQIIALEALGKYKILGQTLDDAIGESFDKVAKMLGFPYPGGPVVEKCATLGDENRFKFPHPLLKKKTCDFSFSGLKTAVRNQIQAIANITEQDKADICAGFQKVVVEIIVKKVFNALHLVKETKHVVIVGGVAANKYINNKLSHALAARDIELIAPPLNLCTDNAAMIAWVGIERLKQRLVSPIDFEPRSRWSLMEM